MSPVFVVYDGRVAARAAASLTPFPKTSRADKGLGSNWPLLPRSAAPAHLARFHIKNLAGRADVEEGGRRTIVGVVWLLATLAVLLPGLVTLRRARRS